MYLDLRDGLLAFISAMEPCVGLGTHDREKLNGNRTHSFYTQAGEFNCAQGRGILCERYPMTTRASDEQYVPQGGILT